MLVVFKSNFIVERSPVFHFLFRSVDQQDSMSEFVWDWPDGWQVGQSVDAQGTRGGKFITKTITRTTERAFTCGCSFTIKVHCDLNKYTIGQLRGTVKEHLGGAVNEKTMGKMSKSASTATNFGNKKSSSMSEQPSTAQQEALSTLSYAVPLYIHIFLYSVSCKDIHFL